MNDIVKEARELLELIRARVPRKWSDSVGPVVRGLLERIQELEQERDAALERIGVLEEWRL